MVEPTSQHLYVMQNEFGLIKIGRYLDVERRRLALQSMERCRIKTVEVYLGCGDMEEDIYLDMDEHRLAGEWFEGSDAARAALCELIDCEDPPIRWPYAHDRAGARAWLDHICVVRHAAAIRREINRQITILRSADGPSWVYDGGIFSAKWLATKGERPGLLSGKVEGRTVNRWVDPDSEAAGVVPAYTASIGDALLAWPDNRRPSTWAGTPIERCIAALSALKNQPPRVERRR